MEVAVRGQRPHPEQVAKLLEVAPLPPAALGAMEDEQAFAFLPVHSTTLPEHFSSKHTGKHKSLDLGKHIASGPAVPDQLCWPQCFSILVTS